IFSYLIAFSITLNTEERVKKESIMLHVIQRSSYRANVNIGVLVALHSDGSSATTPHGMFYINHHYIHAVIKTTSRAP
ncbi:hypothetical protein, partial [Klebsiella variicola]